MYICTRMYGNILAVVVFWCLCAQSKGSPKFELGNVSYRLV